MNKHLFKYTFDPSVPIEDVEGSLVLAILAAEALHGQSQVRLDAAHAMDLKRRICVIDAGTEVGQDLNRLFVGFLAREFGEDSFHVERVPSKVKPGGTDKKIA